MVEMVDRIYQRGSTLGTVSTRLRKSVRFGVGRLQISMSMGTPISENTPSMHRLEASMSLPAGYAGTGAWFVSESDI